MYLPCCPAPNCLDRQGELSENCVPNLTVRFILSGSTSLTNDFVEEPDALHALVDVLRVKVREEVGDGGEHHAGVLPALGVQLLKQSRRRGRVPLYEYAHRAWISVEVL